MIGRERIVQKRPARCGFSLLELLAVTTLIGIVAAVVVPRLGQSGSLAKGKVCSQFKADLNTAAEKFFIIHGSHPTSSTQLIGDEFYGPEIPTCPVDGSNYEWDPVKGRIEGHLH